MIANRTAPALTAVPRRTNKSRPAGYLSPSEQRRRVKVARDRQLVLQFRDGEGLSFQAIAAKLGKPVQGVASLYCRAKLGRCSEVAS